MSKRRFHPAPDAFILWVTAHSPPPPPWPPNRHLSDKQVCTWMPGQWQQHKQHPGNVARRMQRYKATAHSQANMWQGVSFRISYMAHTHCACVR